MNEQPPRKSASHGSTLAEQVGAKARRKLEARRDTTRGVWFGLGMMG